MLKKRIIRFLFIAFACIATSLPAQAGMVGTAQMQNQAMAIDFADIARQRDWIAAQLEAGGVDKTLAVQRVAAMTDTQVIELHQRIDQQPAGGNAVVVILLILLFTELMGYTDIFPFIRPVD